MKKGSAENTASKLSQSFYIALTQKSGIISSYRVSSDPAKIVGEIISQPQSKQADVVLPNTPLDFKGVFDAFTSVMAWYRKFIPLTLGIVPLFSSIMASQKVDQFAKAKGKERSDLSNENSKVYELDVSCYREFNVYKDDITATLEGAKHLPEVMIIGLVSAYDAFLSRLLRVVLNKHEEIVLTSEKNIKFSELSKFSSIEEARGSLIDQEIDSIIRMSHHEQCEWIKRKFKLTIDTPIYVDFIELCERRNLLTHTGGVVSVQYIENCKHRGIDVSGIKIGEKLNIDPKYFSKSVKVMYEMGVILCQLFWQRIVKEERQKADVALNELCFDLIFAKAYDIAESLLFFGTRKNKVHASDMTRRMMVINLANAIRLQGREGEAKSIIDSEDWSATSDNFKICAAAIKGDIDLVVELMQAIGNEGSLNAEGYRTWPVFRGIIDEQKFTNAFENIFGEPLISSSVVKINMAPETVNDQSITKH